MKLNISTKRPTEELVGANRAILRQKVARLHCMLPLLHVVRQVRPKLLRDKAPPELRRGLIKCVADTLTEYRTTFFAVALCREYIPANHRQ